jgi:hypothetical protein
MDIVLSIPFVCEYRIKLQVQPEILSTDMVMVRGSTAASTAAASAAAGAPAGGKTDGAAGGGGPPGGGRGSMGVSGTALLAPVTGLVSELAAAEHVLALGTRIVRLLPASTNTSGASAFTSLAPYAGGDNASGCLDMVPTAAASSALYPFSPQSVTFLDSDANSSSSSAIAARAKAKGYGAVSIGEVMLSSLKLKLEQRGIQVEFRLGVGGGGGVLVCGQQVIVRKENDNDFIVEGPPVPVYFQVRKVLYEHFAFV